MAMFKTSALIHSGSRTGNAHFPIHSILGHAELRIFIFLLACQHYVIYVITFMCHNCNTLSLCSVHY